MLLIRYHQCENMYIHTYHIVDYFRRVFILGYFEEASFFEDKFFVITKKQHVIASHVININRC